MDTKTKISLVQEKIQSSLQLKIIQCNILIVQRIGIAITASPKSTYGQLLLDLGVVLASSQNSIPSRWVNEYEMSPFEILDRIGGRTHVQLLIKKHFKNHSQLKKTSPSQNLTRQDYNRMINNLVLSACYRYPDWGISKILRNLEVVKEDLTTGIQERFWIDDRKTESFTILRRVSNYKELLKK